MKYRLKSVFGVVLMLVTFVCGVALAQTREQREIEMADRSILASISVGASPKPKFVYERSAGVRRGEQGRTGTGAHRS
jgi:hypothetical protein